MATRCITPTVCPAISPRPVVDSVVMIFSTGGEQEEEEEEKDTGLST